MTDHPRSRPGAESVEAVDADANRARRPDEVGTTHDYPEQPVGSGTHGSLMQGKHRDHATVAADADPPGGNQPARRST